MMPEVAAGGRARAHTLLVCHECIVIPESLRAETADKLTSNKMGRGCGSRPSCAGGAYTSHQHNQRTQAGKDEAHTVTGGYSTQH